MRRRLIRGLLLLPLLAAAPLGAQEVAPAKVARSIERIFGGHPRVDTVLAGQARVLRIHTGDAVAGFAQVRNVIGKDQPITFLVAIDSTGVLKDVDVLVYREPYGGEVAYEAWRKQFRGKGPDAPLTVGRDIRNISGATISSHAVTQGVRQALADLSAWRAQGLLR